MPLKMKTWSSVISDYPNPASAPLSAEPEACLTSLNPWQEIRPVAYWTGVIAILLVAFLFRLPGGFSRLIQHDELFHYLAGLSYARDGTLAIGEGRYVRAAPYTVLTGLSMKAFGNGLLALRLPAILSGTLLVLVVTRWLGLASRVAGLIGGGLLALDNFGVQVSDYARFYTLHALMIWLAAISSYALMTKRHSLPVSLSLVAVIVASTALAMELQILTLFVAVALSVWFIADYAIFSSSKRPAAYNRRLVIISFCAAAAAVAMLPLSPAGTLVSSLYRKFWSVAPWGEEQSSDLLYYLHFMRAYGLLAYTFPVAVIAAWHVDRRRALFCVILFVVPIAFASIGSQKAPRYIFYVIPFFLCIWALAATCFLGAIGHMAWLRKLPSWVLPVSVTIATIALVIGTSTFRSTLGKMRRFARTGEVVTVEEVRQGRNFDWQPWMPLLRHTVSPSGLIVGVDDLRMLYFFGRIDLLLNKTIQWDISRREFVRDPRTGVLAISQPDSINFVMSCTASGFIIVPRGSWREYSVIPATADAIEKRAVRVALPTDAPFRVYRWQNTVVSSAKSCQSLASRAVNP